MQRRLRGSRSGRAGLAVRAQPVSGRGLEPPASSLGGVRALAVAIRHLKLVTAGAAIRSNCGRRCRSRGLRCRKKRRVPFLRGIEPPQRGANRPRHQRAGKFRRRQVCDDDLSGQSQAGLGRRAVRVQHDTEIPASPHSVLCGVDGSAPPYPSDITFASAEFALTGGVGSLSCLSGAPPRVANLVDGACLGPRPRKDSQARRTALPRQPTAASVAQSSCHRASLAHALCWHSNCVATASIDSPESTTITLCQQGWNRTVRASFAVSPPILDVIRH